MTFLDRPLAWTKKHRERTLLILFVITLIAAGLSYNSARNAADTAHSLAQTAKKQSVRDAQRIDTLFAERDSRRHTQDVKTYKAALTQCNLQNTARAGTNQIISILKDAFAPVAAAEKAGKKQTPLVHRLVVSTSKLKFSPPTPCKLLLVDPNAKQPSHK